MSQTQTLSLPPFSFDGLKFFVSIFVPERVKKLIKNHNGILIRREPEADLIILDPKRNSTSTGISYAWIEECIRTGSRLDEERFRVEPVTGSDRERQQSAIRSISRSQSRPVSTRNAFTPEDDRILISWIQAQQEDAEKRNKPLRVNGNNIYKDLEKQHPQHTFHSWRDRWVRHLALTVSLEGQDEHELSRTPTTQSPVRRRPEEKRSAAPTPAPAEEREEEDVTVGVAADTGNSAEHEAEAVGDSDKKRKERDSQSEMYFMREEHYYIMRRTHQHKMRAIKTGKAEPAADFFRSLNKDHREISTDEWRDMYNELKAWYRKGFPDVSGKGNAPSSASTRPIEPPSNDEVVNSTQVDEQTTSEPPQPEEQEGTENCEEPAGDVGEDMFLDDDAILDGNDSRIEEQKTFLKRLEDYNKASRAAIPSSFPVNDRMMETFSLWKAVQGQDAESVKDINWPRIASSLGYSKAEYPGVDKLLADWYTSMNFEEFRALMNAYDNAQMDDESNYDEEEEGDDEGDGSDQDEQESEGGDVAAAVTLPSQHQGIFSSAKKRLFDVFSSRSPAVNSDAIASSPSKRVRFTDKNANEVPNDDNDDGGNDDEEDDDDEFELHTQPATRQAADEPDTIDFDFEAETQQVDMDRDLEAASDAEGDEDEDEDEYVRPSAVALSLTPSQQLRAEDVVVSSPSRALSGRMARSKTPTATQSALPRAATTPRQTRTRAARSKKGQQVRLTLVMIQLTLVLPSTASNFPRRDLQHGNGFGDVDATKTATSTLVSQASTLSVASNASAIDRFVVLRYPEDIVIRALHATGNIPGRAGIVVEELLYGRGIPGGMAGVWTANDDRLLDYMISRNGRSRRTIALKHGKERVVARDAFIAKEQVRKASTRRR